MINLLSPSFKKGGLGGPSYGRYYFGRYSSERLNWFHFLFVEGGQLIILIDCMIFLLTFRNGAKTSMSTIYFLTQLDSGIFCLWNVFL